MRGLVTRQIDGVDMHGAAFGNRESGIARHCADRERGIRPCIAAAHRVGVSAAKCFERHAAAFQVDIGVFKSSLVKGSAAGRLRVVGIGNRQFVGADRAGVVDGDSTIGPGAGSGHGRGFNRAGIFKDVRCSVGSRKRNGARAGDRSGIGERTAQNQTAVVVNRTFGRHREALSVGEVLIDAELSQTSLSVDQIALNRALSDVEIAAVGVILIGFHVERTDNRSSARSGSKESDAAALCAVGSRRTIANNQMIDDQHAGVFQDGVFAVKDDGFHFSVAGSEVRKQSVDGRGACLGERRGIVKRPAIADLRVVQANDALVFKRAVNSRRVGGFDFPEVR